MMIDTHAHLDFPEFKDLGAVLERAHKMGVGEIITIGIDLASSKTAAALAKGHPEIYATVGIHPHNAHRLEDEDLLLLRNLALERDVVAIGEIGLDYYYNHQPQAVQQECLRQQLELVCDLRQTVVFHIRDAFSDFLEIVSDYASSLKGVVLHCFSGDWEIAERCLNMGFFLSIPGTVTFPKSLAQQEVVKKAPLDRLLLETDSPFLAPVPYRGKTNEPSFVFHTAKRIAELRQIPLDEVARQTTLNAHSVFGISKS